MNLRQHSEAAAERSLNELPSRGQATVLCTIYIPKAISYVWCDWPWGPAKCTAESTDANQQPSCLLWSLPGFTSVKVRGRAPSRRLSRDGCRLLTTASPPPSRHSPWHTDYTQHILILSFSHMSHDRLGMSQCNYSRLMLVWNLETSPKDQHRQVKGERSQNNRSPGWTQVLWIPYMHWDPHLASPVYLSGSFVTVTKRVEKATPKQGSVGRLEYSRGWVSVTFQQKPQHGDSSLPTLVSILKQDGMRIWIFDS